MKLKENTVLITGGGSGIGLALAERFLKNENKVIICGRNQDKLEKAKLKYPEINILCCDVAKENERVSLFHTVTEQFPEINIIVNNAGIQQKLDLKNVEWEKCKQEIATNLEAPMHLSQLFIPHLMGKENAFIVNVSSGLAFIPTPHLPAYVTAKAGLHSFTFSLRHQLEETGIGVIEIIPPAVKTDLGGGGLQNVGEDLDEFADCVFKGFADGSKEIMFGITVGCDIKPRNELEAMAVKMFHNRKAASKN